MLLNPYRWSGDTPILDQLSTSAFTAFSMRKVSAAYAGACIRVRRASDASESDIAFLNGYLDTVGLALFLSATTGTIVTWYDQSGNGHDITNTDTAQQPDIQVGTFSGHTSLYVGHFNTLENLHSASIGGIDQNTIDMYAVGYKDSTVYGTVYTATQTLGSFGSSYIAMIHTSSQARGYIGGVNNGTAVTLNGEAWWNRMHRTGSTQNNENEIYIESTSSTATSSAANAANDSDTTFIMMGMERENPTSSGYSGDILEIIHFDGAVLSSGDSTTLETDQKSYYNL